MRKQPILKVTMITLFILLGLAIFTACISNPSKARETEILLPSDAEITPWRQNGPPAVFRKDRLFEYINGTQFDNHTAFWQDRYVVVVMASVPGTISKEALNRIAQKISIQIGKISDPPELVKHLPRKNMVPRSQGFIEGILGLNNQYYLAHENVLDLGYENVKGAFATYRFNSEEAHLLIVQYDSSKKSKVKEAEVQKIFSGKYKTAKGDPSIYEDKKGRFYAKWPDRIWIMPQKSDSEQPTLMRSSSRKGRFETSDDK